jgi:exodeoxyribonuclease VII small subunit
MADDNIFGAEGGTPEAKPKRKPSGKKAKAAPRGKPAGVPFEEKYGRLEEIVEAIDREDIPLERMLELFEEGVGLIKDCNRYLQDARLRIDRFVEEKDGSFTLKGLNLDEDE